MKKETTNRLRFEKLRITKLTNLHKIRGGDGDDDTGNGETVLPQSKDANNPLCRPKGTE